MAGMEAGQYPHVQNASRGDEAAGPSKGQPMGIDVAVSHPGRPSLTSPLKRKGSISRTDIDVANVNSTVSMFMGGFRHSWMQEAGADSHALRMPPVKRVKTAPAKTDNLRRSSTAQSHPPAPHDQAAAAQEEQHPMIITIPDTQPYGHDQPDIPNASQSLECSASGQPQPDREVPLPVASPVSYPTAATTYTAPSPTAPTPLTNPRPQMSAPAVPLPPSTISVAQMASTSNVAGNRMSPTIDIRGSLGRVTSFASRSSNTLHTMPTIQTSISVPYMNAITPPPSTSPVSATVIGGMNGLGMRTSTMPSPVSSPQMSSHGTIDVPKYLPDGTCQIHKVDLRNATIEDHNLLLADLQRLGQQIKDSAIPNQAIVVRYTKLTHALDGLRRQINPAQVQSARDLVSGVMMRRTPTAQDRPNARPASISSQPTTPLTPTAMIPPAHRLSLPRLGSPAPVPPPVMLPRPQQNYNSHIPALASMANIRSAPAYHEQVPYTQIPTSPATARVQAAPSNPNFAPMSAQAPPLSTAMPENRAQNYAQQRAPQIQQFGPAINGDQGAATTPWCNAYLAKLRHMMAEPTARWEPNDVLRANLLEQALKQGDDLFVTLHLVFCTLDHPTLKHKYHSMLGESCNKLGLELLSQLLFPNSSLSERTLDTFVQIPLELGAALNSLPGFSAELVNAIQLLQNIRSIFDSLYTHCIANQISCPSQALMVAAGIQSPALQRTIGVSLSQMLKHHKATQGQRQGQAHRGRTSAAGANQELLRMQQLARQARPQGLTPGSRVALAPSKPLVEQPDFHIFVTDWGGKVAGWKLIQEWRHLPADLEKPEGDSSDYFTYFKRCVTPIIKVESVLTQRVSFSIDGSIMRSYPKRKRAEGTPLNTRPVRNLSKLYRLRCVSSKTDLTKLASPAASSAWRSLETNWPPNFFAELNDKLNRGIDRKADSTAQERELSKKRKLHFRRKRSWGKDCATDLTDGLELGENTIQFMMLDSPVDDGSSFYLAVEEVEIANYSTLSQLISQTQVLPAHDAKKFITSRLERSADAMADDDDICLMEEDTVIVSITCPMSQQLINTPVRGRDCKHLDCFDLDGYLSSRTKLACGFSVPDSWKCPICSCECTPAMLVVDGFMLETVTRLREVQAQGQFLETKSVVIRSDGMWRPNDPPETTMKKIKKEMPEVISLLDD